MSVTHSSREAVSAYEVVYASREFHSAAPLRVVRRPRQGATGPRQEVRVARITAVVIGLVAVIGGIYAKNLDVAFLVALAFAIAASANLPSILYSLFWRRFTARGALWSIYGGLISSVGLIIFSPVVSGQVDPATGAEGG
jgi:cation/acetate symporter